MHIRSMVEALNQANVIAVIFDNTVDGNLSELKKELYGLDVIVCGDGYNYGLSSAFNQSINMVANSYNNITGFMFFDQDSTLKKENISSILVSYDFLTKLSIPVGVLGACPVDNEGNRYHLSRLKNDNLPDGFEELDYVISSFSYIPYDTILKIGSFDEELFIDLVDTEFSFRARSLGLVNVMDTTIVFTHVVGESRKKFLGLRGYSISSPLRNYYQIRNIILVGIKYKTPCRSLKVFLKRTLQILLSGVYEGNLVKRLRFLVLGVRDGIRRKGGKCEYIIH